MGGGGLGGRGRDVAVDFGDLKIANSRPYRKLARNIDRL